ncbi:MAG: hypothetical protein WBA74_14285 [Cyclobacteriaceae bacterium]
MHKVEGDSFEEQWKNALDGAELNPPDKVWTAIDGEMANIDAGRFRKQMLWYRGIAAALLLLMISTLFIVWQLDDGNGNPQLADNNTIIKEEVAGQGVSAPDNTSADNTVSTIQGAENNAVASINKSPNSEMTTDIVSSDVDDQSDYTPLQNKIDTNSEIKKSESYVSLNTATDAAPTDAFPSASNVNSSKIKVPHQTNTIAFSESSGAIGKDQTAGATLSGNLREELLFDVPAARTFSVEEPLVYIDIDREAEDFYYQAVPVYDFRLKNKNLLANNESGPKGKSWADFNVRGGVFEPNYERQATEASQNIALPVLAARRNNFVEQEENLLSARGLQSGEDLTAGYSYTVSLNYGRKISKKFFLQSGFEYGIYEAIASTNKILSDGQESRIAVTEQIITDGNLDFNNGGYGLGFENVELNNSFQFASIPVKVGYTIFSSKLTVSVSSGVNTGFYMGNSFSDPDRNIEEVSVSRSDNSIYRNVNISAVGGLSVGYKLLDQYLFTIEPVYQRALTSFTRESSNFTALPENFGVSAGVRIYIK